MSNARFRIRLARSLCVTSFKADRTLLVLTWKAFANSFTASGSLRIFVISSFVYLIHIFSASSLSEGTAKM